MMDLEKKIATLYLGFSLTAMLPYALSSPKNNILTVNPNVIQEEVQAEKHYAIKVDYNGTKDVEFPNNALGKPDGQTDPGAAYAIIHPKGEITLIMKKPFSAQRFGGINGIIFTKGECNYEVGYEVLTEGLYGESEPVWRWLLPTSIPGGIYVPVPPSNPEDPKSPGESEYVKIYKIKIRNIDNKPLYIDAVIN